MWPVPPVSPEIVSVALAPESVTMSWIKPGKKNKKKFELKAHTPIALDSQALEHAILFNPTLLQKKITSFLYTHSIQNAAISASIKGKNVTQKIVTLSVATPEPHDFNLAENTTLDSVYLHPTTDGRFRFYAYGISQEQLFQYKLLAINTPLHLVSIVPDTVPLLQLYTHLHGRLFRHGDLSEDQLNQLPTPQTLFTKNNLKKLLHISSSLEIDNEKQFPQLCTALGLHLLGASL